MAEGIPVIESLTAKTRVEHNKSNEDENNSSNHSKT